MRKQPRRKGQILPGRVQRPSLSQQGIGDFLCREDNVFAPGEIELEDGAVSIGPFFEFEPGVLWGDVGEVA